MDKQYKMLTREEALALRKAGAEIEATWVRKGRDTGDVGHWISDFRDRVIEEPDPLFDDYFRVEVE